ncbi:ion transporter [Anaerovorax sp. IOR16]|uniref:ion transporter n=1 Tax=Anaerovorax sp. IOR16 TaxID=2773458 RepID=UPI0019D18324|nr:ion transporter [Anaerovorax sp. IOR16]
MRKRIYDIIEVATKKDKTSAMYDYVMLFMIVVSVVPLCFKTVTTLFLWIDRVTVTVFIIDYILRWGTADLKYQKWGKKAFAIYPFTAFAIIDFLSILPSLTALNMGFKLFRLLRLNKAIKVLKILRYSKSFNLIITVIRKEKQALLAVCYLAGGYILLSALIMFSVEPDSFNTFFDAIYWAVVTLTTVGYGDIYPVSVTGKVFGMISSFMGIAIVALPTGIITAGYMCELNKNKEL